MFAFVRRVSRAALLALLGLVTVLALGGYTRTALAQDTDAVFYSDLTLTQPAKTYTQPSATSGVQAMLTAGTVVEVPFGAALRQTGTDGSVWVHVRAPDGTDLGWLNLNDLGLAPALAVPATGQPILTVNPITGQPTTITPTTTQPTTVSPSTTIYAP
jgi:hypothetical protein